MYILPCIYQLVFFTIDMRIGCVAVNVRTQLWACACIHINTMLALAGVSNMLAKDYMPRCFGQMRTFVKTK